MRFYIALMLISLMTLSSCSFVPADEKEIREMLEVFLTAISTGDEDLASTCLMDVEAYRTLNPDVSARMNSESFLETVMAELFHAYRDLRVLYKGHKLELKDFEIGGQDYQYKGRSAFKNNVMTIEIDDSRREEIFINGIVLVNDQWRIVNLSGIEQIGS